MSLKKKERAVLKAAIKYFNTDDNEEDYDPSWYELRDAVVALEAEVGLGDEPPKNNEWFYTESNDEYREEESDDDSETESDLLGEAHRRCAVLRLRLR